MASGKALESKKGPRGGTHAVGCWKRGWASCQRTHSSHRDQMLAVRELAALNKLGYCKSVSGPSELSEASYLPGCKCLGVNVDPAVTAPQLTVFSLAKGARGPPSPVAALPAAHGDARTGPAVP